jgi:hypothetical protein
MTMTSLTPAPIGLSLSATSIAGVLVVAFGIVPFVGTGYLFEAILTPFLALSLAALGLNLLTGYAGQVSLGSAAFMAVGAFAAYNFNLRIPELPFLVSLVLAGVTAAAVGLVFGLPSLRLRGFYLAVSTLAAQFFVQWALTKFSWFSNGSPSGVINAPPLTVFGLDLGSPVGRYLFSLSVVTVLTIVAVRLVRSQTGRNFIAIRDQGDGGAHHRRAGAAHQARRLRGVVVLHRRRRGAVGVRLPAHRLNVEAVRIAQEKFGKRTLTGEEVRWGFENLRLDEARVAALGAKGLFHSINVTCANHEGDGRVTFQQWDGEKWTVVSDWISPDWALLRPIIEQSAATYANEQGITPRDCAAEQSTN